VIKKIIGCFFKHGDLFNILFTWIIYLLWAAFHLLSSPPCTHTHTKLGLWGSWISPPPLQTNLCICKYQIMFTDLCINVTMCCFAYLFRDTVNWIQLDVFNTLAPVVGRAWSTAKVCRFSLPILPTGVRSFVLHERSSLLVPLIGLQ